MDGRRSIMQIETRRGLGWLYKYQPKETLGPKLETRMLFYNDKQSIHQENKVVIKIYVPEPRDT